MPCYKFLLFTPFPLPTSLLAAHSLICSSVFMTVQFYSFCARLCVVFVYLASVCFPFYLTCSFRPFFAFSLLDLFACWTDSQVLTLTCLKLSKPLGFFFQVVSMPCFWLQVPLLQLQNVFCNAECGWGPFCKKSVLFTINLEDKVWSPVFIMDFNHNNMKPEGCTTKRVKYRQASIL